MSMLAVQAEFAARPQLARLGAGEAKALMQAALEAGAWRWVERWLPLRFSQYARALGYHTDQRYRERKARAGVGDTPLVFTGDAMRSVLNTVRVVTGGSAQRPWADVRYRTGGPRATIVFAVLRTILQREIGGEVIGEVQRVLDEGLQGLVETGRRGMGRGTLGLRSGALQQAQSRASRMAARGAHAARQAASPQAPRKAG